MKKTSRKNPEMPKALVDEFVRIGELLGDDYLKQCEAQNVEAVDVGWVQSFEQEKHVVCAHIFWPGEVFEKVEVLPFMHFSDLPGAVVKVVKRGQAMRSGRN